MNKNYYFPMFINLKDKNIIIFGAGKIAYRRVCSLVHTGCNITIVAPDIYYKFKSIEYNKLNIINDCYDDKYINNQFIVFAITDNNKVNENIYNYCSKKNIIVNIASDKTKCSFFFPAIIYKDNCTIGICGNGSNHTLVKSMCNSIKNFLKVGDKIDNKGGK